MVDIGKKIKEEVEDRGITVSEFARRINKSRENAYDIFKRETIDTGLLVSISEVLEHDFFQYYSRPVVEEFERKIKALTEENALLKEIQKLKKD